MSIDRNIAMYSLNDVLEALAKAGEKDAYALASELTALSEDALVQMADAKEIKTDAIHIEVTCECTVRRAYDMYVSRDEYESVLEGDTGPISDLFDRTIRSAFDVKGPDVETDYAVYNLDTEKQVVEWR